MGQWVKIGTDVVVGGGAGVVDQLLQNQDEKREVEKAVKLGIMSQYGTYYNYGVPILAILGTAFGFLRGDWATRLVTAGSQLAGRKVTRQVTKKSAVPWTAWRELSTSKAREAAIRAGARGQVGTGNLLTIPIVADETVLV